MSTPLHDLPLFLVSCVLLNLTPGADSLYIVTRSASLGLRAGVVATFGIVAGCCVHIVAAAFGLSAILATSATAFLFVKLAGALYLIYLGMRLLLAPRAGNGEAGAAGIAKTTALPTVFVQGVLTNLLNPKIALFFLAFVPQFIDAHAPDKTRVFLALGAMFCASGTAWCLLLAWSAARLGAAGLPSRFAAGLNRGVGALFVVLGVRLALTQR